MLDIFLAIPYNNFRTDCSGELCNGSTYDSDSYCLGSNPSSPASCLHGQAVKTLPSQGKIMGSIPIGGATCHRIFRWSFFVTFKTTQALVPSNGRVSQIPRLDARCRMPDSPFLHFILRRKRRRTEPNAPFVCRNPPLLHGMCPLKANWGLICREMQV